MEWPTPGLCPGAVGLKSSTGFGGGAWDAPTTTLGGEGGDRVLASAALTLTPSKLTLPSRTVPVSFARVLP